jgi:hypothetical protein
VPTETIRFAKVGTRIDHPPKFWLIHHLKHKTLRRDQHFLIFVDTVTGDKLSITFTDEEVPSSLRL